CARARAARTRGRRGSSRRLRGVGGATLERELAGCVLDGAGGSPALARRARELAQEVVLDREATGASQLRQVALHLQVGIDHDPRLRERIAEERLAFALQARSLLLQARRVERHEAELDERDGGSEEEGRAWQAHGGAAARREFPGEDLQRSARLASRQVFPTRTGFEPDAGLVRPALELGRGDAALEVHADGRGTGAARGGFVEREAQRQRKGAARVVVERGGDAVVVHE